MLISDIFNNSIFKICFGTEDEITFDDLEDSLLSTIFYEGHQLREKEFDAKKDIDENLTYAKFCEEEKDEDDFLRQYGKFDYFVLLSDQENETEEQKIQQSIFLQCSRDEFEALKAKIQMITEESDLDDFDLTVFDFVILFKTGIIEYLDACDFLTKTLVQKFLDNPNFMIDMIKEFLEFLNISQLKELFRSFNITIFKKESEAVVSNDSVFKFLREGEKFFESQMDSLTDDDEKEKFGMKLDAFMMFHQTFEDLLRILNCIQIKFNYEGDDCGYFECSFGQITESIYPLNVNEQNTQKLNLLTKIYDKLYIYVYDLIALNWFFNSIEYLDLDVHLSFNDLLPLKLSDILNLPGRKRIDHSLELEHQTETVIFAEKFEIENLFGQQISLENIPFSFGKFLHMIMIAVSKASEWTICFGSLLLGISSDLNGQKFIFERKQPSSIYDLMFFDLLKLLNFLDMHCYEIEDMALKNFLNLFCNEEDIIEITKQKFEKIIADLQQYPNVTDKKPRLHVIHSDARNIFPISKEQKFVKIKVKDQNVENITRKGFFSLVHLENVEAKSKCVWMGIMNKIDVKSKSQIICVLGPSIYLQLDPITPDSDLYTQDDAMLDDDSEIILNFFTKNEKPNSIETIKHHNLIEFYRTNRTKYLFNREDLYTTFENMIPPCLTFVKLESKIIYFLLLNVFYIQPKFEIDDDAVDHEFISAKTPQFISYDVSSCKMIISDSFLILLANCSELFTKLEISNSYIDCQENNDSYENEKKLENVEDISLKSVYLEAHLNFQETKKIEIVDCRGTGSFIIESLNMRFEIRIRNCFCAILIGNFELYAIRVDEEYGDNGISIDFDRHELKIQHANVISINDCLFPVLFERCHFENTKLNETNNMKIGKSTGTIEYVKSQQSNMLDISEDQSLILQSQRNGPSLLKIFKYGADDIQLDYNEIILTE